MKQAINFRLSQHAITVLSLLAESLELPKTEIVERALQSYFEMNSPTQHSPLMAFAGILNDEDADDMLKSIYSSRTNTDRDIDL
jgi:hypothetical protein